MKLVLVLLLALPLAAQTRIASDFEIRQMENQIARSNGFNSQYAGHLNLGDLRMTRNEKVQARTVFLKAYAIASKERLDARRDSDLTRYAIATSLAAAAQARLGDAAQAFALAEEAIRYASDSANAWNIYANLMSVLHRYPKAVSAARNAVRIEERDADDPLGLAIDRYTLASNLIFAGQEGEGEKLLIEVIATLHSPAFASLQKSVREHEAFETYNTVRDDESGYVSLLNRSQLRLAEFYENKGDIERARAQYRSVLAARSDDADALAGLARLARGNERDSYFIDAFNANPFSLQLIRDYQAYLRGGAAFLPAQVQTTGDQMRVALQQMQHGEWSAARATLDAIAQKFPNNEALRTLQQEIELRRSTAAFPLTPTPDLRALTIAFQENTLTPEQRKQLDAMTFTNTATFNDGPPFESGFIGTIPFRFSGPTAFHGTFAAKTPLRLTFRVLGATRVGDADGLLLEPLKAEALP